MGINTSFFFWKMLHLASLGAFEMKKAYNLNLYPSGSYRAEPTNPVSARVSSLARVDQSSKISTVKH